ncbi:Uu.00g069430.m01.CDS01 [Anthostomella pinea]|uniref:Uu.00g069430.m01.CDS01 n=1 Tax=Anthostomella pinea TaxID=933095 RepID=A0AAI8VUI4_9PEZI|nr:Uu.00g069430.m01.CDS01 [Anthostomella pinea]
MALQTAFEPTLTSPAIVTSPPTAQFTPGPGCIGTEDHWVVVSSCFAGAVGDVSGLYPSPDWLTCQLTQFGPPVFGPVTSCYMPYSAEATVDYTECPSGYSGATTKHYTYSDGLWTDYDIQCCPTQYYFNVRDLYTGGLKSFTTERDGLTWTGGYPVPGCAESYITELSGSEIPVVQTAYNTNGWEKRQLVNVP